MVEGPEEGVEKLTVILNSDEIEVANPLGRLPTRPSSHCTISVSFCMFLAIVFPFNISLGLIIMKGLLPC